MDIHSLAEDMRHPDPRVRVQTLRILAMVEETKALDAIRWIYQNDPEPGVREVANWAGNLIWRAEQQGHSTQRAMESLFSQPFSPEREALFLRELAFDIPSVRGRRALALQRFRSEQEYRRQMADLMQLPSDEADAEAQNEVPPPTDLQPLAEGEIVASDEILLLPGLSLSELQGFDTDTELE